MARKSPARILEDLVTATRAWQRLSAHRSFYGYSLERFKQAIQPSLDARAEIADLTERLRLAIEKRERADFESLRLLRWVSFAVQGTPEEGEDGPLIEAMGYVPWRARGRPRLRGRRAR